MDVSQLKREIGKIGVEKANIADIYFILDNDREMKPRSMTEIRRGQKYASVGGKNEQDALVIFASELFGWKSVRYLIPKFWRLSLGLFTKSERELFEEISWAYVEHKNYKLTTEQFYCLLDIIRGTGWGFI